MNRSLKKGPFVDPKLLKKIHKFNSSNERPVIKTWSRDSTIIPAMVGHVIAVHNGRTHIKVHIVESMINCKLGEFSPTRVSHQRTKDKDKKGKK